MSQSSISPAGMMPRFTIEGHVVLGEHLGLEDFPAETQVLRQTRKWCFKQQDSKRDRGPRQLPLRDRAELRLLQERVAWLLFVTKETAHVQLVNKQATLRIYRG